MLIRFFSAYAEDHACVPKLLLADALMGHFGVQARALSVDECRRLGQMSPRRGVKQRATAMPVGLYFEL